MDEEREKMFDFIETEVSPINEPSSHFLIHKITLRDEQLILTANNPEDFSSLKDLLALFQNMASREGMEQNYSFSANETDNQIVITGDDPKQCLEQLAYNKAMGEKLRETVEGAMAAPVSAFGRR